MLSLFYQTKNSFLKEKKKVFLGGFIMTFKKNIKSFLPLKIFSKVLRNGKAQSIFEYLILTAVVAAVVMFFAKAGYFTQIKTSCENAFKRSVEEIVK